MSAAILGDTRESFGVCSGTMNRTFLCILLCVGVALLTGCLFEMNLPVIGPEGSLYVFLAEDASYDPLPEEARLHQWIDDAWISFAHATVEDGGAVLALSPDGLELLYMQVLMEGFFDPAITTIYRVSTDCPETAIPEPVLETGQTVIRVAWAEDAVWILTLDDEGVGQLGQLDLASGQIEPVQSDVLSFLVRDNVLVFSVEEAANNLGIGAIGWWDPNDDEMTPLVSLAVTLDTAMSFMTLPHSLLWDASPDGRYIALSLIDNMFLRPALANGVPSLYLIDLEEEVVERLAVDGISPAFSPDGTVLAYLQESDSWTSQVILYTLEDGSSRVLAGTDDAQTVHWLSPDQVVVTVDTEDGETRLAAIYVEPARRELTGGR